MKLFNMYFYFLLGSVNSQTLNNKRQFDIKFILNQYNLFLVENKAKEISTFKESF